MEKVKNEGKLTKINSEEASLFFAEYIFLVEGKGDEAFLNFLFSEGEKEWRDMVKKDIYILKVDGVGAMKKYLEMLNEFKLNVFVIFDEDKGKSGGHTNKDLLKYLVDKKEDRKLEKENWFMFLSDLEEHLLISRNKKDNENKLEIKNIEKEKLLMFLSTIEEHFKKNENKLEIKNIEKKDWFKFFSAIKEHLLISKNKKKLRTKKIHELLRDGELKIEDIKEKELEEFFQAIDSWME